MSLSDFLTLFSARTTRWFFATRPARALILAAVFALGCSTILAALWPFNENDDTVIHGFGRGSGLQRRSHRGVLGVVWLYCFIWWLVQDAVKVAAYILLERFDILHHRTNMFQNARGSEDAGALGPGAQELAIGLVENKLVAARVRDAVTTISSMEKSSQEALRPQLQELEAAMRRRNNEGEVARKADAVVQAVHRRADNGGGRHTRPWAAGRCELLC